MQVKIFNIPIPEGDSATEDMNVFLRSKKILSVQNEFVTTSSGLFCCFVVRYIDVYVGSLGTNPSERVKIDYREVLDTDAFGRFSNLRETRKRIAQEEGIPAFAVLTDAELAELAKIETLTIESFKTVKGIAEKEQKNSEPASSFNQIKSKILFASAIAGPYQDHIKTISRPYLDHT
jgi:superfamily II DNA helicase RecQ